MYKTGFILLLTLAGLLWINSNLFGQENETRTRIQLREQLKDMNINLPFIDRDGDGINDLMQSRLGLKFMERIRNRKAVWDQLLTKGKIEENFVDTNGDGKPDTAFHELMRSKMNELIDSDGDGTPDTPLREYMRKQFQTFDQDGDGIPDDLTPEQIRQHMEEMRQWHQEIMERIKQGLPPFIDENNDGIPDNMPEGFPFQRRRRGM